MVMLSLRSFGGRGQLKCVWCAGLRVTDCTVRDGLGWGEQRLINGEGCPVDSEIMGNLHYAEDKTRANVHFQAHKFPYTASVYYQCNVKLCKKSEGGCDQVTVSCGNRSRLGLVLMPKHSANSVDRSKHSLTISGQVSEQSILDRPKQPLTISEELLWFLCLFFLEGLNNSLFFSNFRK